MSTDLENVIQRDEDLYELPQGPIAPAQPTSSRLDNIVEAQVTPTPEPVQPETGPLTTEGIITELKLKEGETKGKKWVKYGVKIEDNWYATFSGTLYETCLPFKEGRVLCNVEYGQNEYGRELLTIRAKSLDEVNIPI